MIDERIGRSGDVLRVLEKLQSLTGPDISPHEMFAFVHIGTPVAKSRARWSRKSRSFYTPTSTSAAEDEIALRFREAMRGHAPFDGSVAIVAIFYRPNFQRIDSDNLMKLVMDAATKAAVWVDDCYVTAQASFVEFDREKPRTLVAFCPSASTLDRSYRFTCQVCETPFKRPGRAAFANPPKFCSKECRSNSERKEFRCARCGVVFQRASSGQRYCSEPCRSLAVNSPERRKKREEQRPWPKCQKCGGRVSRREYINCSNCSPKGRKRGSKNNPLPERAEIELEYL